MFNYQNDTSNSGNLPEIDTERRAIDSVIAFLNKHLPNFPNVFKNKTSITRVDPEDDISQILWAYLERMARKTEFFMIQFQYRYLKTRRSSDFGIIEAEDNNPNEIDKAFFVIEAKRLPTPGKDKDGKSREKEYVSSNYGGMERYKKGHHGKGLSDSAIIGYIQKEDCNHWHQKINDWINDLIQTNKSPEICWDEGDLLILEKDLTTTQKYNSKNIRIIDSNRDSIKIHHYLMKLA